MKLSFFPLPLLWFLNYSCKTNNQPNSKFFFSGILDEIHCIVPMAWRLKWELLALFTPFLIVLVVFVAFVYWNGSVVLGDFQHSLMFSNEMWIFCFLTLLQKTNFCSFFYPDTTTGAKEAHTVSPHFAQLMYFSLVSALFMAPCHFNSAQVSALLRSCWKNMPHSFSQLFITVIASLLSIHFFRSDNLAF